MGEAALQMQVPDAEFPRSGADTHADVQTPAKSVRMTEEEYLAFERAAEEKHEYRDGEVVAMSGGSAPHASVAVSIGSEFRIALRGRNCRVHSSDLRVYIPQTRRYVYPDGSVVCGRAEFRDGVKDTLLNPKVVVEVLSPSSEAYDRGDKSSNYQSISSLMHYVLASQDEPLLEVYTRQNDGSWHCRTYGPGEKAAFSALGCELDVDLVYTDVFDENPAQATG